MASSVSWRMRTLLTGVAFIACGGAWAHHSIAMYDHEHPIELVGTVREYRFVSPHSFILLEVKGGEAALVMWKLEGNSPNSLSWDGWSNRSLRPGDEIR